MLELRPSCENCETPLPPESKKAKICSFECTFCSDCVDNILHNVCPNCGGGFVNRPIRPVKNWKNNNNLSNFPASRKETHCCVSESVHAVFSKEIRKIPPEDR